MGIRIFLALCMLSEVFLVYVLYHFIQEGRRGQAGRRTSSLHRYGAVAAASGRATRRRVIQITIPESYEEHTGAGRRAS
jgi:hypothetical protein